MQKLKILIKAPILSRSGYGEQARFALRALRAREDLFDIYLINIPWGGTGMIIETSKERSWIDETLLKTHGYANSGGQFGASLQITIPNEFEKLAPVNIGYTAGIETTKVAPGWLQKANQTIDKIITISEHAKRGLVDTVYEQINPQTNEKSGELRLKDMPVEVVNYPVREHSPEEVDIDLVTDKNLLVVSQWGPRKNLDNTIKWFVEEFRNDSDVGLILKMNSVNDSIIDREITANRLMNLLNLVGPRECKIYLLHGSLTEGQLSWLYQHPTIKGLVNIAHGEGFGLPLFEAAAAGLPLVTLTWGGQMDFICKPNKKGRPAPVVAKVDYTIQPVQPEAVWEGVIQKDSMWAHAKEASYKRALRSVIEKETYCRNRAKTLQKYILSNFVEEKKYEEFAKAVYGPGYPESVSIEDLPKISVITSVYDGDDHIEGFLEDITNQTIFEEKCELVLVNADSPGNEEKVIKKYMKKYPNNIVYKKLDKDPGIYGTWNEALNLATGEFITNANLDDRKASISLQRHADALVSNPEVALVYADSLITNAANETFEENTSEGRRYNFEEFSKEAMLRGNQPHNNPMWRKELHDKYGLFDDKYRSAGDWEFFLRCSFGGEAFKKLSQCLGLYYYNPKGISTNFENFSWKQEEEKEIYTKYKDLVNEK